MHTRRFFLTWLHILYLLMIGVGCQPPNSADRTATPLEPTTTEEVAPSPTFQTLTPEPLPTDNAPALQRQWAAAAVDGGDSEEAAFAIGEPDAAGCDLTPRGSSWVYLSEYYQPDTNIKSNRYLQLFYTDPVLPTQINVHLAYTFNAIVTASLIDIMGVPHEVYSGSPDWLDDCPFVLTVNITDINDPVYAVRLDFDTLSPEEESNLTAVDAVELVGMPLTVSAPTPLPTPYLTLSSLGFNASQVQQGFVYFEILDKNTNETLTSTECDAFSYNLTDTERTIRFFSCADQTEIWLYLPREASIGDLPLNTYPNLPSAQLFYAGHYIPAMEGNFWIDLIDESSLTGVLDFVGFDPQDAGAYYGAVAVMNQIPIDAEAAQKPGDMIIQWAEDISASSELSPLDNNATQALGTSDTWENCSNAVTAWKPSPSDGQPWIELYFKKPVQPVALDILFTGNPESVEAVNLLTETDYFPLDLSSSRVLEGCPTALTFDSIDGIDMGIQGVQILFSTTDGSSPIGIDAIQLFGIILE